MTLFIIYSNYKGSQPSKFYFYDKILKKYFFNFLLSDEQVGKLQLYSAKSNRWWSINQVKKIVRQLKYFVRD